MAEKERKYVIEADLSLLTGTVTLPHPDDFNGEHWQAWTQAVEETAESHINRLYCYAGLRFIEKLKLPFALSLVDADGIGYALPVAEFLAWQQQPKVERIRVVSFFGREMNRYMAQVMDPKG